MLLQRSQRNPGDEGHGSRHPGEELGYLGEIIGFFWWFFFFFKGQTVPDSLPATPNSPPTRRLTPRGTPRVPAPLPLSLPLPSLTILLGCHRALALGALLHAPNSHCTGYLFYMPPAPAGLGPRLDGSEMSGSGGQASAKTRGFHTQLDEGPETP